jgi:hypothetical protein
VCPSGQAGKREKEKGPIGYGLKVSWARSVGPTSLGSARGVSSACGSAGQVGQVGLARPAAQQAGSGRRLSSCVGRLGPKSAPSLHGQSWAGSLLPLRLLLLAGWLLLLPSFSLTGRPHVSVLAGSDVAGNGSGVAGGCACGRRGCVCVACLEGVPEKASEAWPRRERDVAATSRGCRAWRGWGHGRDSRHDCARTSAGPGFLGLRRGRAVHGAPASRARSTTRRRRGDGGCGEDCDIQVLGL